MTLSRSTSTAQTLVAPGRNARPSKPGANRQDDSATTLSRLRAAVSMLLNAQRYAWRRTRLETCGSSASRAADELIDGLLGVSSLPTEIARLLPPCASLHVRSSLPGRAGRDVWLAPIWAVGTPSGDQLLRSVARGELGGGGRRSRSAARLRSNRVLPRIRAPRRCTRSRVRRARRLVLYSRAAARCWAKAGVVTARPLDRSRGVSGNCDTPARPGKIYDALRDLRVLTIDDCYARARRLGGIAWPSAASSRRIAAQFVGDSLCASRGKRRRRHAIRKLRSLPLWILRSRSQRQQPGGGALRDSAAIASIRPRNACCHFGDSTSATGAA